MWPGFDPTIQRQLAALKELTARRYRVPANEWPVVYVEELNALLVVREWPNGELTAYTCDVPRRS